MNQISQRSTFKSWIVILTAALFFLFEYINMNSFDSLNAQLRQAFHVNALEISNLSAMYFYANVLFLIPAGLLLDRFSTKKLILMAMAVSVIATYVFATTDSFAIAKLCRFVTGMASTFCLLSAVLLTSRWFESKTAALVMGIVVAMPMLGGTLAQQITLLSDALGSWREALMVVASVGVVFFILIGIGVKDFPAHADKHIVLQQQRLKINGFWRSLGQAISNRQVWFAGLYTNFLCLPVFILGALWGKEYLMVVHGLSANQSDIATSLIFIGMLIGSPLNGGLSDGWRRRKMPMILGAALTLLAMLAILYAPDLSALSLSLLFFALGFFSASQIITYALLIESSHSHLTASTESVAAVIIMSSGALFQPFFGYLMQQHWSGKMAGQVAVYAPSDYQHALLLLPIAFVASIVMALFIKETRCRRLFD